VDKRDHAIGEPKNLIRDLKKLKKEEKELEEAMKVHRHMLKYTQKKPQALLSLEDKMSHNKKAAEDLNKLISD
jgi:hypothetical protein